MHSLANKSIFASTTILNLMILASCIVTGSSRHITNNEGRPSDILNTYDVGDSLLWKMLSAGLVEYSPGFTVNSRIAQSNEDAMDANKLDTFQKRRDDHANETCTKHAAETLWTHAQCTNGGMVVSRPYKAECVDLWDFVKQVVDINVPSEK